MININQASKLTQISSRTIRYWCEKGHINATKLGKMWIFEQTENKLKKELAILADSGNNKKRKQ